MAYKKNRGFYLRMPQYKEKQPFVKPYTQKKYPLYSVAYDIVNYDALNKLGYVSVDTGGSVQTVWPPEFWDAYWYITDFGNYVPKNSKFLKLPKVVKFITSGNINPVSADYFGVVDFTRGAAFYTALRNYAIELAPKLGKLGINVQMVTGSIAELLTPMPHLGWVYPDSGFTDKDVYFDFIGGDCLNFVFCDIDGTLQSENVHETHILTNGSCFHMRQATSADIAEYQNFQVNDSGLTGLPNWLFYPRLVDNTNTGQVGIITNSDVQFFCDDWRVIPINEWEFIGSYPFYTQDQQMLIDETRTKYKKYRNFETIFCPVLGVGDYPQDPNPIGDSIGRVWFGGETIYSHYDQDTQNFSNSVTSISARMNDKSETIARTFPIGVFDPSLVKAIIQDWWGIKIG